MSEFSSRPALSRRMLLASGVAAGTFLAGRVQAEEPIEPQPYFADVQRALAAMSANGAPVAPADAEKIAALAAQGDAAAVADCEKILARYTIAQVTVEDGYPITRQGAAPPVLVEQGWRSFLVRVANPLGSTASVAGMLSSGAFLWPGKMQLAPSSNATQPRVQDTVEMAGVIKAMWMASDALPMKPPLAGGPVEYRTIQLFARDRGRHGAYATFALSPGDTAALYIRRGAQIEFDCLPSRDVAFAIRDVDGKGCVASLNITDEQGRNYPAKVMRIAPDMSFQPQVYRGDGETVRLPDGTYAVESRRGPEYLAQSQTFTVGDGRGPVQIDLKRWIDPAKYGWYSGDPHIHAAGCSHYEAPTQGVSPETMIRHVRGEGLALAGVLTWGPGYYYQKQFFTGHVVSPPASLEHPELQAANGVSLTPRETAKDKESILRYDVEVSGFPSSASGHLILMRLKDQDYPGAKAVEDWPSWNVPILTWAKAQGAVVGYAHCSSGMLTESQAVPNYEMPTFAGVGTNEAIVDVTHGLVDFLCGAMGPPAAELNAWYHMLNSGYRLALVGETDFPCISDERPGMGRTYVRLDQRPTDDAGYGAWTDGLKAGRLYFGDGRSHFLEFAVNGVASGGEVKLGAAGSVEIKALVAARLEPQSSMATTLIRSAQPFVRPTWHIERCRIGETRNVPVELIVNGEAVERQEIVADGKPRPVRFRTKLDRSSWVALRILPSSHAHPVFVHVGDKPIRASRRSAQWCRQAVDALWSEKERFIRERERPAAAAAYDHARKAYDAAIAESEGA